MTKCDIKNKTTYMMRDEGRSVWGGGEEEGGRGKEEGGGGVRRRGGVVFSTKDSRA